ncbi:MAG: transposase family protein, partial [Planctomycetia bacterium]|nr:transposase family protein [Planctomycetia bacterium]
MPSYLLYHVQGIRQYQCKIFLRKKGKFYLEAVPMWHHLKCPCCRSKNGATKGGKWRTFLGVPMGFVKTEINVWIPRLYCHDCGAIVA